MKNVIIRLVLLVVVMTSLVVGYYKIMEKQAARRADIATGDQLNLQYETDLDGRLIVRGVLLSIDDIYYLQTDTKTQIELMGKQLSLNTYLGKSVEISGTMVEDKLAVEKIQEI